MSRNYCVTRPFPDGVPSVIDFALLLMPQVFILSKPNPIQIAVKKIQSKGIRTYSSSVMEAKLLCPNGFSMSIMTEWIINDPYNTRNNKQDCEQKEFIRLSKNLKAACPQLAICILGDGHYPNDTIFSKYATLIIEISSLLLKMAT